MAETMPVAEVKPRKYEVMFLLGQQQAAMLGESLEAIQEIFRRAEATVLSMTKWDERRLAYEIEKQKRGTYLLAYISCMPGKISGIERDVQISEKVTRALVVTADHLTDEEIATHDYRDELMAEAKMRAERDAEQEAKSSNVRLGAPPESEAGSEVEASDGDEGQQADESEATDETLSEG